MRSLLWVLLLAAPVLADRIHLKDDRVLEGKAKQDGDYWVIKTKIGSIRVHKDEVVRIDVTDDDGAPVSQGGEEKSGGSYQSAREGFSFHVKGKGWKVEDEPPRPMVSAIAIHDGMGVEMSVVRLEDNEPSVPLSEDAAKSLRPTVEALLAVPTLELDNVRMERYPVASGPAFVYRADAKRRLTKTDLAIRAVVLKSGGHVWILQYEAPMGAPSEAEGAFEELVDSFQAGPSPGGGEASDAFTSGALAFSIRRPEGWIMEGKEGEKSASASLSARDGSVGVTLEARDLDFETELRTACADLIERLGKELASFEAGTEELRSVANRTARVFPFTYRREAGPRFGMGLVTREGTRVFEVLARANEESKAREGLETVMEGFRVIQKEASVGESKDEMGAIKALREGDELYLGGEYKNAQSVYRKAVKAWPKFAHASLMLARTSLIREEMDEACSAAETAHQLLPGRREAAEMLACCRARQAKVLAAGKDYAKAAEALCKAAALKVASDKVEWEVGEAAAAFTGDAKGSDYEAVWAALKKAHTAFPEDAAITNETARSCRWLVGREIEAENWDKALTLANEGLKIKPKDGGLTEMVEQIKTEKERKKK